MSGIRVEGLTKSYGDTFALRGVTWEAPPGSITGLLGPNGSGKTTTVSILSTITAPTAGSAFVAGIDVVERPAEVRRRIGVTGQATALDAALSAQVNLEIVGRLSGLSRQAARGRAGELLDLFHLADEATRPLRTFSGGMRRRVDIAASLVARPSVVFLDEPTTGLDPRSRLDLWGNVRELQHAGTTVLITTQYLEEADQLADQVIVLDGGHVVAQDTPAALKRRIGGDIADLVVARPATEQARQALHDRGWDTTTSGPGHVRVALPPGTNVVEAVRALDSLDISTIELTVRPPTLDDVFLTLTDKERAA